MTYDWNKMVDITVPTGTNGWIYSGEVTINGVKVRFPVGTPTSVPEPAAALLNKMIELEREDADNTAKPNNHYVGNVTIPAGKTLTLAKGAKVVDEDGVLGDTPAPSDVVILPETEIFPQMQGYNPFVLTTPLNADMEIGKTYTFTIDGVAYDATARDGAEIDPDFEGTVAVDMMISSDTGFSFAQLNSEQVAEAGFYAIFSVPDPSVESVTLSIVEAAKTESTGGGVLVVNVECDANEDMTQFTNATKDKTFEEIKAVYDAGGVVHCRLKYLSGQMAGMRFDWPIAVNATADGMEFFSFVQPMNMGATMITIRSDDFITVLLD